MLSEKKETVPPSSAGETSGLDREKETAPPSLARDTSEADQEKKETVAPSLARETSEADQEKKETAPPSLARETSEADQEKKETAPPSLARETSEADQEKKETVPPSLAGETPAVAGETSEADHEKKETAPPILDGETSEADDQEKKETVPPSSAGEMPEVKQEIEKIVEEVIDGEAVKITYYRRKSSDKPASPEITPSSSSPEKKDTVPSSSAGETPEVEQEIEKIIEHKINGEAVKITYYRHKSSENPTSPEITPSSLSPDEKIDIVLRSSDGETFVVDKKVAEQSLTIKHMIDDGFADGVVPLAIVGSSILAKVIEFCKKRAAVDVAGADDAAGDAKEIAKRREAELKAWDAEFVKVDHSTLIDIIVAANYLNIKSLLDMTCQTIANQIKKAGTPENIRKAFNIEKDLTPEEEEEVRSQNPWAWE